MPTTPAGDYLYYRDLTDANATALGSFVCRLDLSASSFDFSKVRSDGADLAVYDMTGGAAVPYWLEDFDATARRARLYFKATNTGNAHRLYYGNPAGVSASNFTAVFTKGTGFDSGWGDLSTATAGGTQELAVLAASTGVGDPRGRRVWRMKRSPAIPGTTNSPDLGVRNLSIVTDQHGRIVPDGSGNWVGYYGSQPPTTPRRIFRAISSDEGETWTGHTLVLSPDQLYDINGVMPGSVIQISPTSYVMWITSTGSTVDGGPSTGGVGFATAADIMGPWTKAGIVIKANTPLITGYAAESVAIPHVRRMSDGVWTMVCESRASGPVAWKIAGFVASSYSGPWASMNSGNPILVGGATPWGSVGFADPYLVEISPGLYCLFTDGHTGNDTTPGPSWNGFNCQCGFFTSAAYNTSSWTPDPGSPPIGNHLNEYGVHTEPWVIHPTTGEYVNFFTRFDSFDVNNPYGDTYKIHAEKGRGGLVVTRANADGAVVGMPLAAGTFTAESRSWMTTHRSEDADIYVLSLMDSATLPTPDTSTNVAAAGYLRLEIRRTSFASGSPGDIQFRYWDASSTARFLPGGGTVKIAAGSSDTNRDILAAISDDGTNFLLSVVYADDLSPIASGSVAKSAVKAFTHPPFLVIGELYTSSGAGGTFFRHVGVRPYAAVEPAFTLQSEVPTASRRRRLILARAG